MPNRHARRRSAAIARRVESRASSVPRRISATFPVMFRAAEGESGTGTKSIEIHAYTGEPMRIYWYEFPVVIDLSTVDVSAQQIPLLYDHRPDVDFIVGQSTAVRVDDSGIHVSGIANGISEFAQKVRDQAATGYIWQASVGADPTSVERIEPGTKVNVNGREYVGPLFVGRGCVLREVSFVVLGGDRRTSAIVAKNRQHKPVKGSAMNFEEWLVSMGFDDPSALTDIQMANMRQMFADAYPADDIDAETEEDEIVTPTNAEGETPAVTEEEPEAVTPANAAARRPAVQSTAANDVMERRRAIAAEDRRIAAIRQITASHNPTITVGNRQVDLQSHAIEHGWTRQRTELEALRRDRGEGPRVITRSNQPNFEAEAIVGAVLLRAGARLDNPVYANARQLPAWLRAGVNDTAKNQIMEAAHRLEGTHVLDLARQCLRLSGRQVPNDRFEMIRAASSGSNFVDVFTTSVNAILMAAYLEGGDTTQSWTTTTTVNDYKINDRLRVLTGEGLTKRARGGKADHTKFGDMMESYKIASYSRQFEIDEIDFINDNLGVFSDLPRRFGQAAARLRPDLVYSILLANNNMDSTDRALFNSTDGNTAAGVLNQANLKAAIQSMFKQRENAVNLNVAATHLIVPAALEFDAYELLQSPTIVVAGTTDTVRGSMNTLTKKQITVVSESRIENGLTDPDSGQSYAGSGTQWFLASTFMNTIEVAYLTGNGQAPRVRNWVNDRKGEYGMGWDVELSIGAKALDWRGLWRRTG